MRILVGLGNPDKEYAQSRHNVGFRIIDRIADHPKILPVEQEYLRFKESKIAPEAQVAMAHQDGENFLLVKPQVYENQAGECVRKIMDYHNEVPENVWLFSDNIDLPIGDYRVKLKGTSDGHNGIESVIHALSSENIPRLQVGIAPSKSKDMKEFDNYNPGIETREFELGNLTSEEIPQIDRTIEDAVDLVIKALNRPEGFEGLAHTEEPD